MADILDGHPIGPWTGGDQALCDAVATLQQSSSGLINFSDSESPTGIIDGFNRSFSLLHSPSPASSLMLFRNGVKLISGSDFTLLGNVITYIAEQVPKVGDVHEASYRY